MSCHVEVLHSKGFKKELETKPNQQKKENNKKLRQVGQRTETIERILEDGLTFAVIVSLRGGINKINKGKRGQIDGVSNFLTVKHKAIIYRVHFKEPCNQANKRNLKKCSNVFNKLVSAVNKGHIHRCPKKASGCLEGRGNLSGAIGPNSAEQTGIGREFRYGCLCSS